VRRGDGLLVRWSVGRARREWASRHHDAWGGLGRGRRRWIGIYERLCQRGARYVVRIITHLF